MKERPRYYRTKNRRLYIYSPANNKTAGIGFGAAPGGPAVAGRRTNAPPRRTGVPAAAEPKIERGVRFFSDHPVPCKKGCKTPRYFVVGFSYESNFRQVRSSAPSSASVA